MFLQLDVSEGGGLKARRHQGRLDKVRTSDADAVSSTHSLPVLPLAVLTQTTLLLVRKNGKYSALYTSSIVSLI